MSTETNSKKTEAIQKIQIKEPILESDFKKIIQLVDQNLSPDEVGPDYLKSLPSGSIYVAKANDKIAGAVVARLPKIYFDELHEKYTSLDLIKTKKEKIGNIHIIIVSEQYRGQGIGQRLIKKALTFLKQSGVKTVVAHIWMQSPKNGSFLLFSSMGFKPIRLYEKTWQQYPGYKCVRCGSPCKCDFLEMALDL